MGTLFDWRQWRNVVPCEYAPVPFKLSYVAQSLQAVLFVSFQSTRPTKPRTERKGVRGYDGSLAGLRVQLSTCTNAAVATSSTDSAR